MSTVVHHDLIPPIRARYIRFRVLAYSGHCSMRLELYGCKGNVRCYCLLICLFCFLCIYKHQMRLHRDLLEHQATVIHSSHELLYIPSSSLTSSQCLIHRNKIQSESYFYPNCYLRNALISPHFTSTENCSQP